MLVFFKWGKVHDPGDGGLVRIQEVLRKQPVGREASGGGGAGRIGCGEVIGGEGEDTCPEFIVGFGAEGIGILFSKVHAGLRVGCSAPRSLREKHRNKTKTLTSRDLDSPFSLEKGLASHALGMCEQ